MIEKFQSHTNLKVEGPRQQPSRHHAAFHAPPRGYYLNIVL